MSGTYISYPAGGGGGGGTTNSISFSIGSMDAQAGSPFGATISSDSLFMQSASATAPGVVNLTTQTLGAGTKTFAGDVLPDQDNNWSLGNADTPLTWWKGSFQNTYTNFIRPITATSGVKDLLLYSATIGSDTGILQLNVPTPVLGGATGALRFQVGSNSVAGQILKATDANGSVQWSYLGSISLTNGVSGVLPQVNLTLTPTFTQATIGSITVTSSAGGAAYTVRFPGAQAGASGQSLTNDGAGNLYWATSPAAGSTSHVQFNSGGNLAANQGLIFDSANRRLSINSGVSPAAPITVTPNSDIAAILVQAAGAGNGAAIDLDATTNSAGGHSYRFFSSGSSNGDIGGGHWAVKDSSVSGPLAYRIVAQASGSVSFRAYTQGIATIGTSGMLGATLTPTMSQATIGSVTVTSSAGGAAYTVRYPGGQGTLGQTLFNDGAGNLSWGSSGFNKVVTCSTDYTMTVSDGFVSIGSGTVNVILPDATLCRGQSFVLSKNFTSLEGVRVSTVSSQTLDSYFQYWGSLKKTIDLDMQGEGVTLLSMGTGVGSGSANQYNWTIVDQRSPSITMPSLSSPATYNVCSGIVNWTPAIQYVQIYKDQKYIYQDNTNGTDAPAWRLKINVTGMMDKLNNPIFQIGSGVFTFGCPNKADTVSFQPALAYNIGSGSPSLAVTLAYLRSGACTLEVVQSGYFTQAILQGDALLVVKPKIAL